MLGGLISVLKADVHLIGLNWMVFVISRTDSRLKVTATLQFWIFAIAACSGGNTFDSENECIDAVSLCYEQLRDAANTGGDDAKLDAFIFVYEHGVVLQDHVDEALKFLLDSAVAGNSEAQYNLGFLMQTGTWLDKDVDAALPWLSMAASAGIVRAEFLLVTNHYTRYLTLKSTDGQLAQEHFDQSLIWLGRADTSGYLDATSMLARILLGMDSNSERGLELLRKAASAGDELAIEKLALLGAAQDN